MPIYPNPTPREFVERFTQFESTEVFPDWMIQLNLDAAVKMFPQETWGEWWTDAVMLDAAHNLTLQSMIDRSDAQSGMLAAAGPISNVSAAGVSLGFNSNSADNLKGSERWYMKTVYGQQFVILRNRVIPMGVMAVTDM